MTDAPLIVHCPPSETEVDLLERDWKPMAFAAASFFLCFTMGLLVFTHLHQQDVHEQETQQLRSALQELELKEMRASKAAREAAFWDSPRKAPNETKIKEAGLKDAGRDNPALTSNLNGGLIKIEFTAQQLEYLTQNIPAGNAQNFICNVKLADKNVKDKSYLVARIVEFK